jgi:hypothetical protein
MPEMTDQERYAQSRADWAWSIHLTWPERFPRPTDRGGVRRALPDSVVLTDNEPAHNDGGM